jgi:hypothetical protein
MVLFPTPPFPPLMAMTRCREVRMGTTAGMLGREIGI